MNTPFSLDHSKGQSRLYDRIAQRASGYRTTFDVRVDGLTGEDEFIVTVFENIGLKDAVLDFGCGDGAFTVRLGHRSRQVIGLDVSQQMLGYAVNNLAESGNHNVSFMLATGQQLPLNSESIDAVVSRRGPATSRRCLPEVARTLRKGGILLELHVGGQALYRNPRDVWSGSELANQVAAHDRYACEAAGPWAEDFAPQREGDHALFPNSR